MKNWDSYERDYILDHGGYFDDFGVAHFDKNNRLICEKLGHSVRYPNMRTLVIPSVHGCCLIFELMHFVID